MDTPSSSISTFTSTIAQYGISLLFECVNGNYGNNIQDSIHNRKLGSRMYDDDDNTYCNDKNETDDDDDDDEQLLRRMTSWMSSLSQHGNEIDGKRNDDNDIIKTRPNQIIEKNGTNEEITHAQSVKFEYPPVSSFKRVPRYTKEETKELFFTEPELCQ